MYDKNDVVEILKDNISRKLKEIMDEYAMTSQDLGNKVGKTRQLIDRYIQKLCLPSLETLYMIAYEFDVPITYFLPEKIDDFNTNENIDIKQNRMLKEFKNLYFPNENLDIKEIFLENIDIS